jgi:hypothetical protein
LFDEISHRGISPNEITCTIVSGLCQVKRLDELKILWEIRARVVGKGKFPKNEENLGLCSLWNLPADILC